MGIPWRKVGLCLLAAAPACSRPPPVPPPEVVFSSFIGGELWDAVRDVAVDDRGFIYLAGGTRSDPVLPGAGAKGSADDSTDVFVAKLDPSGRRVIWTTTLGGPGYDQAYALEVTRDGGVVVGGRGGEGFPTTVGAAQAEFRGGPSPKVGRWYGTQDGIVLRLSPDGELLWATYIGCASYNDFVRDIALTPDEAVAIGTASDGCSYPTPLAEAFSRGPNRVFAGGRRDAVLAVLSADGGRFEWATYAGGSGDEWAEVSVRSDEDGNVLLLTVTDRGDAPTYSAVQPEFGGVRDFYLVKFSRTGEPRFATYLGGSGGEHIETHHLATTREGDVILAAATESTDYPVTEGAFQREFRGAGGRGTGRASNYFGDAVISRLSADGTRLIASTYVGGSLGDSAEGVAVDDEGRVHAVGGTFSPDFPGRDRPPARGASTDAFGLALSPDLTTLLGAIVLGGEGGQMGRAAAVARAGHLLILGGATQTGGWPTRGAIVPHFAGVEDGVLAGLRLLPATTRRR